MSNLNFKCYTDNSFRFWGGGANVWVLWKGLELLSANGGWFEIKQLLFADCRIEIIN